MRHFRHLIAAAAMLPSVALSQDVDPIDALREITEAVCAPIANINQGQLAKTYFEGEGEVRLAGVLDRLADVGVSARGGFDTTEYVNGLASAALAGEISSQRDCNLKVYSDFSVRIQQWLEGPDDGVTINADGDCAVIATGDGSQQTVTCSFGN